MAIDLRFYVYELARPDGGTFYVGKGSGGRINDHEAEARTGHRCHKCNVIRKLWRMDTHVIKRKIFFTDDEVEAYTYEQMTIATYPPGTLTNRNAGGLQGAAPTAESRAELAARARQAMQDPEIRARWQAGMDAARARMRTVRWGDPTKHTQQAEVMRASARKRWAGVSPEARRQIMAEARAHITPSVHRVITRKQQQRFKDPQVLRAHRSRCASPEHRAKIRAGIRSSPKFQARVAARRRIREDAPNDS